MSTEVRLGRSPMARLFSGGAFQGFLTFAVALEIALVIIVATQFGFPASGIAPSLPGLVFWALWILGWSGGARVDDRGVRWRLYVPHRYTWEQIERIDFGGTAAPGAGVPLRTPAIFVVAGHRHKIGPAVGVSERDRTDFGRALVAAARRHGVPVEIPPDSDSPWAPVAVG